MPTRGLAELTPQDGIRLLEAVQQLAYVRDLQGVIDIVKAAARQLVACEGVTFVLRDDDRCFYVDESCIAPLWKGQRFPANVCVSGWAMIHRESVMIEDVFADPRVPREVYSPTFVKSMAMVPIRREEPLGAIGAYWASRHRPSDREMALMETLADSAATAIANVELYRRLTDAIRLREEFITVASHELRTPMTPLHLSLDIATRALQAGRPMAEVETRLAKATGYLQRLEAMVGSLVDQLGLWSDRLVLQREEADLRTITSGVVERYRSRAAAFGSAIELGACNEPLVGRWDPRRVDQALACLVDNAVKFGEGRQIDVRTSAHGTDEVTVEVTDHGQGIARHDQQRIFERFERAQDTKNFGGFGLGLWTARRIAQAHGGRVTVKSDPREATTFALILPRDVPPLDA